MGPVVFSSLVILHIRTFYNADIIRHSEDIMREYFFVGVTSIFNPYEGRSILKKFPLVQILDCLKQVFSLTILFFISGNYEEIRSLSGYLMIFQTKKTKRTTQILVSDSLVSVHL